MGTALIVSLLALGALAAGVLIGRYYVPDDRMLRRTANHARSYMRAVNHLLSRNRDAAVDELRAVVSENVEDIEPYFALGALFRGRGECERAIRVHQAIDLREGQNRKIRLRARYELGLDFRAAGMPRRATRAMEECLADDDRHEGALRALCGLYEEQGRYSEAAQAWARLCRVRGEDSSRREHHLLVAAAQRGLQGGDLDSARRLLRDAEKIDDATPHFLVVAAELSAARTNHDGAAARVLQALSVAPDLAGFLVPGLVVAERARLVAEHARSDEPPGDEELDERAARRTTERVEELWAQVGAPPTPYARLALAELRSRFDAAAALEELRAVADDHPDALAARVAAARLALAGGEADEIRSELLALVGRDGALAWAADGVWRCDHCGERADDFFWRCGSCRRWGSVRLDVGRDAAQSPPAPPPRERRELPRAVPASLIGVGGDRALPAPSLEHGLSELELRESGRRTSPLGRVGSWLSSAWSSARGGKRKKPADDDLSPPTT